MIEWRLLKWEKCGASAGEANVFLRVSFGCALATKLPELSFERYS